MKKLLLILAVALQAFAASAQSHKNFDPEKMSRLVARKMAENLLLDDKTAEKFIPVYQEYSQRFWNINAKYRTSKHFNKETADDAEVEARIKSGFKKSQEILDLRVSYYDKFRTVLSPRQIEGMYRAEKNIGETARKKSGPHHGKR